MYIAFDSYEFYYQTFDKRIDRLFLHEYDSFYYLHNLANSTLMIIAIAYRA